MTPGQILAVPLEQSAIHPPIHSPLLVDISDFCSPCNTNVYVSRRRNKKFFKFHSICTAHLSQFPAFELYHSPPLPAFLKPPTQLATPLTLTLFPFPVPLEISHKGKLKEKERESELRVEFQKEGYMGLGKWGHISAGGGGGRWVGGLGGQR